MNDEIRNILNNIDFSGNQLVKVNDKLFLTKHQIEVLKSHDIKYETATSLRDLMIKIEDVTDYDDNEELEQLLYNLSERNYYENTNK